MGLLENFKSKLAPAKSKVAHFTQHHEDRIERGLDKAAHAVDKSTRGKYSDRIHSGTDKAKGAVDRFAHKDDGGTAQHPDASPPPPAS
jgi:hypothetical protein